MSIKARNLIAYIAVKYNQNWDDIYNAVINKEKVDNEMIKETIASLKGGYVTILDSNYPEELKVSYKPPFVIFLHQEDQTRFNDMPSRLYTKKYNLVDSDLLNPYKIGLQEAIKLNLKIEFELAFNMLTDIGFDEDLAVIQALRFIKDYETNVLKGGTLA